MCPPCFLVHTLPESQHKSQILSFRLHVRRSDCYSWGPRTAQDISSEAFGGVTNKTHPLPPPPQPQAPPMSPPPNDYFEGSRDTCQAYFYPDPAKPNAWLLDCVGADDTEIFYKRRDGTCMDAETSNAVGSQLACSDGGFDSIAILWTGSYLSTAPESTQFACDYGTSLHQCNPRTRDTTTDVHCLRNSGSRQGSCRDSCWVDTDNNVYHTDEQFDERTVANGGTVVVDSRCHDGGPNSVSNRCGFGTMSTRCGPARTIAYFTPSATAVRIRGGLPAAPYFTPDVALVRTRAGLPAVPPTDRRLSASVPTNYPSPPPPPPRDVGAAVAASPPPPPPLLSPPPPSPPPPAAAAAPAAAPQL